VTTTKSDPEVVIVTDREDAIAYVLLPTFDFEHMAPAFTVHAVSRNRIEFVLLAGGDAMRAPGEDDANKPLRDWIERHSAEECAL